MKIKELFKNILNWIILRIKNIKTKIRAGVKKLKKNKLSYPKIFKKKFLAIGFKKIKLFFLVLWNKLRQLKWQKIKAILTYDFIKGAKKKKILYGVVFLLGVYLLLVIFAEKIETYITFPGRSYSGYVETKLQFENINIKDKNGNNINGLFIDSGSEKTIYYFHGNGGPLPVFYSDISYLRDLGYNVMAYDFPGYGKSTGFPYEKDVYNFTETFYKYVKDKKNLKDENVIIWGYSIGTATATDFVYKNPNFDKLVLVSPLASRYDMGKQIFGFVLQKLLFLPNSFVSSEKVKYIEIPVLIIHGNDDEIISFNQGKKVFSDSDSENKYFIEIDGIGHNGIIYYYGNTIKDKVLNFLETGDVEEYYQFIDDREKSKIIKKVLEDKPVDFLDFKTDSSITKFVNSKVSFDSLQYVPENLESISSKYVNDAKGGGQKLRKEANKNLQFLAKAFYDEFGKKLKIVSAYRSYGYQQGIKSGGCPDRLCAKAGFSEHQSGLAVDIWEASNSQRWVADKDLKKYYEWLDENAYKYGFHNSYQNGLEVDGYEIEPWHWRYIGEELALLLKEKEITFAEFYFGECSKEEGDEK